MLRIVWMSILYQQLEVHLVLIYTKKWKFTLVFLHYGLYCACQFHALLGLNFIQLWSLWEGCFRIFYPLSITFLFSVFLCLWNAKTWNVYCLFKIFNPLWRDISYFNPSGLTHLDNDLFTPLMPRWSTGGMYIPNSLIWLKSTGLWSSVVLTTKPGQIHNQANTIKHSLGYNSFKLCELLCFLICHHLFHFLNCWWIIIHALGFKCQYSRIDFLGLFHQTPEQTQLNKLETWKGPTWWTRLDQ